MNADTLHVLVIDDEEAMREYLRFILKREGYQVHVCKDGEEGLKRFFQGGISLVVTDIMMPGKDGIEAIIEMRRYQPPVPIVAVSGVDSHQALLRIANMFDADATLKKPFSREELLATVAKALKRRVAA